MLPWLIAPPALCAYAAVLQESEPALTPIPLTANQKAMFDALSKAGCKRVRVGPNEKAEQRYVSVKAAGSDAVFIIYVSPERTNITTSVDFVDTTAGAFERFASQVKTKFPGVEVDEGILDDAYVSRTILTKDLTDKWALDAIEVVGKAASLAKQKELPKVGPDTTDALGKTLVAAGYKYSTAGPFYQIRITFTDNKRAQNVFIRQAVWDYNSLKVQEVYSTFYESTEPPSADTLKLFSQKIFNIGGIILEQPSDKQKYWRMRFRLDAPIDITPARLRKYVGLAAGTADALEREITPTKEDTL